MKKGRNTHWQPKKTTPRSNSSAHFSLARRRSAARGNAVPCWACSFVHIKIRMYQVRVHMHAVSGLFSWSTELLLFAGRLFVCSSFGPFASLHSSISASSAKRHAYNTNACVHSVQLATPNFNLRRPWKFKLLT